MKALSVFSGGLDSLLASELIRAQGIDVLALFFETPFFDSKKALKHAAQNQLPIKVVDITQSHLEVVKSPRHGYGENMNPCIDCHGLMIQKAGELLEHEDASFIITGEVLGQRPMSQNRKALSIVESLSGYSGLVLRPLCAKRLPPTIPETEGWVDREALKGFSGRSRKPQMALAKELNILDYPAPAGGCLLTDPIFSKRLKDLMSAESDLRIEEIEGLKVGRHFRLGPRTKVIIGRNKQDNNVVQSLVREPDLLLHTVNIPGPTALISGLCDDNEVETASEIVAAYSDAKGEKTAEIRIIGRGMDKVVRPDLHDKSDFRHLMI
jgi:tRNA U34 2-thiouridine synthase MnmA/TrmU